MSPLVLFESKTALNKSDCIWHNFLFAFFWSTKNMKFHFWWGTKLCECKQETGNDCDIISGYSVLQREINKRKFACHETEWPNWHEVTNIPSLLFSVACFCTPPEGQCVESTEQIKKILQYTLQSIISKSVFKEGHC